MSAAIEIAFFCCAAIVAYAYVGYPILLSILSPLLGRPAAKAGITPRVSLIVAAYNEEKDIGAKIENALGLDYPPDRLEIIIASDCSTDRTCDIVREFGDRVILYQCAERLGKTAAQNRAASIATGQIIVFSDATTVYDRASIRKLVRSFADTTVGCVAGRLVYVNHSTSGVGAGCVSYWTYENVLKNNESRLSSLIGVSGCMYAVRRTSYIQLGHRLSSDFVIAAEIRLLSLRTVHEPEAICYEQTNWLTDNEFRMRVRVIEQTFTALAFYRQLLNPFRYGLFSIQMISHKLIRYAVPWFLLAMLGLNIALAGASPSFSALLALQGAFYASALMGLGLIRLGVSRNLLSLPAYFLLTNAAAVVGLIKYLRGESYVVWEPVRDGDKQDAAFSGSTQ
jgi:cellulose synthase/poly-beta-1,6-N-acetylglucosamine synthase-like glycosyltransferase